MKRDTAFVDEDGQLSAAWEALERTLKSGPSVDIAVRRLRKTLLKPHSGVVHTGQFLQAVLAPLMARFLPRASLRRFLRV